ncbi:Metalloprotease [Xylariaceae sp. FL1019]|nr:Metalloprotease [Xylariaceae sp. FL1019]
MYATTNSSLCTTPGCLDAAANILKNLHPNYQAIDPCEDFDLYVCGNYPSRFQELGFDNADVLGGEIQGENNRILDVVLNDPPGAEATPEDVVLYNMMLQDYTACADAVKIAANGLGQLPAMISKVIELFPVDYTSNETLSEKHYDDLASAITYLASIGTSTFGDFWTYQDMQGDSTYNIPFFGIANPYKIDQPAAESSGIYSTLYETLVEGGDEFIAQLTPYLPKSANGTIPQLTQNLLNFVTPLAELEAAIAAGFTFTTTDYPFQGLFEQSTLDEASRAAPALVLDRVINSLKPEGYTVDSIAYPFKAIYPLMSDVISKQSLDTIQAFMLARVLISYGPYTAAILTTPGGSGDRSAVCEQYISTSLAWISSRFWLERKYSMQTQEFILSLSEEMREAFLQRVDEHDWIAEADKPLIKDKIQQMRLNIGYPELPDVMNATALLDYYDGINITDSWFDNVLSIRQWDVKKAFAALTEPIDRREFLFYGVASYTANSRDWREHNAAHITSGAIQSPWYHANATRYLTFGTIGYLTAHEMTHNLDNFGILISNERKYQEWLSSETKTAFDERTECVIDQYDAIPVRLGDGTVLYQDDNRTAIHVIGNLTSTENIADLGGINVAYEAWQRTRADYPAESQRLPGLEQFSPEQLFFLQFGNSWCTTLNSTYTKAGLTDLHSPDMARISGTVANSRGFRDAFKCKKREPTCEMW